MNRLLKCRLTLSISKVPQNQKCNIVHYLTLPKKKTCNVNFDKKNPYLLRFNYLKKKKKILKKYTNIKINSTNKNQIDYQHSIRTKAILNFQMCFRNISAYSGFYKI